MKILFLLYGIGRGLATSEPSIMSNVILPLIKQGNKAEVIYCFNEIKEINNPRSEEKGLIEAPREGIFKNAKIIFTNPSELLVEEYFELSKRYKDIHNDNYLSYRNLVSQLAMLNKLSSYIDLNEAERVVFCRDDLYFPDKITNWKKILKVSERFPVVPSRQWHSGVFERFLICNSHVSKDIAQRSKFIPDFLNNFEFLNGEILLNYVFDKLSIKPASLPLKTFRVRIDKIQKENFLIPFWRPKEMLRIIISRLRFIFS